MNEPVTVWISAATPPSHKREVAVLVKPRRKNMMPVPLVGQFIEAFGKGSERDWYCNALEDTIDVIFWCELPAITRGLATNPDSEKP